MTEIKDNQVDRRALALISERVSGQAPDADLGPKDLNLLWRAASCTLETWSDDEIEAEVRHFDTLADGAEPLAAIRAGDLIRTVFHWRPRPPSDPVRRA